MIRRLLSLPKCPACGRTVWWWMRGERSTCGYALDERRHHMDLMRMAEEPPPKWPSPRQRWEEAFRRSKTALGKSPKDWLGPNNDPLNLEVRERVLAARRLFEKIARPAAGEEGR